MQFSSHQELTTDQTQGRKSDTVSACQSSKIYDVHGKNIVCAPGLQSSGTSKY